MGNSQTIDIRSDAFARRLANLLSDRREASGATIRELVKASDRAFNAKFLRAVEDGRGELDEETVCELAALYGAELAEILPTRLPLRILEPAVSSVGVISTSGITAEFDPHDRDSLLTSYLYLVRQLRDQEREPIIDLRREDVETIATYLDEPAPSVLERLMTLMGATQLQRRAMVGMFIAGAIVIGLAGSGVAALNARDGNETTPTTLVPVVSVETPAAGSSPGDPVTVADDAAGDGEPTALAGDRDPALDGAPGSFPAPTTPTVAPVEVIVVEVPVEVPAEELDTVPPAETAAPSNPPTGPSTGPGQVATGTPPVAVDPVTDVADPPATGAPVETAPAETAPPLTIPDLPYDPPATTATPTTAPPATTAPAPVPTEPPATTPPATDAPPTTEQVATGSPPVPAP